ncbi:MAG: hypothetical protein PHT02_10080 [Tissierellia bacterium]|nr:hypothetical protein [Tissierellia bacterium]
MLEQPIYSLFIRLIPETFLVIYSICLLSNSKYDFRRLLISSLLGGTVLYIVRLLPIHFGIHTIVSLMFDILISVKLNYIDVHKAIAGAMISVILIFISDLLLFVIYTNILHIPSEVISKVSLLSVVSSIPSLLIFYIIIRLVVYLKGKRG